MKVLFLNHKIKKCGVYQYGKRLFAVLKKSTKVEFIFREIDSFNEYTNALSENDYHTIFYNYHPMIMGWLNNGNIQRKVKNIGLQHDLVENDIFDITMRLDTTLPERINRYNIQRPLIENVDELLENYTASTNSIKKFIDFSIEGVPIFGSFGFGFYRKRFDLMVKLINDNCDNAIIKIIMTNPDTMPSDPGIIKKCLSNITKPDIRLMVISEFVEENDLLLFLRSNTLNIFTYESHPSAGVSSVPDYALSVTKPLAITKASWFRHFYTEEIDIEKRNINYIIENANKHCDKVRKLFSNANLIRKVEDVIMNTC
jgi:hypothetical protein